MTDLATLKTWLDDAETARHKLMMGEREVSTNPGGYGETTWAQVNADKLDAYIASLKNRIAVLEKSTTRRRPLRVSF